jgi:hypothetical protein
MPLRDPASIDRAYSAVWGQFSVELMIIIIMRAE